MKARIKLEKFPEGTPGYYAMMKNEAEYERVKNYTFEYERSKRVTHYLVPASVFERLLNLDRASEKMCGHWEEIKIPNKMYGFLYKCSCCGELRGGTTNFCPDCGADLREVEEYDKEDPNRPKEEQNNDNSPDESSGS